MAGPGGGALGRCHRSRLLGGTLAAGDVVYYLVHSPTRRDSIEVDQVAARSIAAAAATGAWRLVYPGGLSPLRSEE